MQIRALANMASLFLIYLLCATTAGVSGQFQLEPLNVTVLRGSDVRFNATLTGQWQIMTWYVGGWQVLTINQKTGPIDPPFMGQYKARNCSSAERSCWEFSILNVNLTDSGPVICFVQGNYGQKRAQLDVQESGTVGILGGNLTVIQDQQVEFQCVASAWFPEPTVSWTRNGEAVNSTFYNTTAVAQGVWFNSTSVLRFQAVRNTTVACWATVPALKNPQSSSVFLVVEPPPPDWTVLIAVVVSIGGFALLVLLILRIIFCCRRRKKEKKSNYEDAMRRVRTQSQTSGFSTARLRQGQANPGYVTDGQTSVSPSEFNDSGFSQTNQSRIDEIPDVVNSNQVPTSYTAAFNTLDGSGFRKHRHLTFV